MHPNTKQEFGISLYGRLGYLVMAFLFLFLSVFVLAPFVEHRPEPMWQVVLLTALGVLAVTQFAYSLSQFFRRKPRFIVTPEADTYHGLYTRKTIPWDQILDCSLDFAGKNPMVFLKLRLKDRKWLGGWVRFDPSGMTPNYETLYRFVCKYVKQTPNNGFQSTSALTRRRA